MLEHLARADARRRALAVRDPQDAEKQSSALKGRQLEREAQRNVELVWLTGKLMADFKTIADFRKDNGAAIRRVCAEFVARADSADTHV